MRIGSGQDHIVFEGGPRPQVAAGVGSGQALPGATPFADVFAAGTAESVVATLEGSVQPTDHGRVMSPAAVAEFVAAAGGGGLPFRPQGTDAHDAAPTSVPGPKVAEPRGGETAAMVGAGPEDAKPEGPPGAWAGAEMRMDKPDPLPSPSPELSQPLPWPDALPVTEASAAAIIPIAALAPGDQPARLPAAADAPDVAPIPRARVASANPASDSGLRLPTHPTGHPALPATAELDDRRPAETTGEERKPNVPGDADVASPATASAAVSGRLQGVQDGTPSATAEPPGVPQAGARASERADAQRGAARTFRMEPGTSGAKVPAEPEGSPPDTGWRGWPPATPRNDRPAPDRGPMPQDGPTHSVDGPTGGDGGLSQAPAAKAPAVRAEPSGVVQVATPPIGETSGASLSAGADSGQTVAEPSVGQQDIGPPARDSSDSEAPVEQPVRSVSSEASGSAAGQRSVVADDPQGLPVAAGHAAEGLPASPPADTAASAAHRQDGVARVAGELQIRVSEGPQGQIEIALDPEELGSVRVGLVPDRGEITVVLAAERPETADLLRRNADSLARDLRDAGYGDVSFRFGSDTTPGGGRPDAWSEPTRRDERARDAPAPAAPTTAVGRSPSASGSLDLRL